MPKLLILFKNFLFIYFFNFSLYLQNGNFLNIIHYEIYNFNKVSTLIMKRTLNEMLRYNNRSQLKVSQINNNIDDYEENKISSSQTGLIRTSKKKSNNNKSKNTKNYIITKNEETLEDLLKEYDDEMREINNNNNNNNKTFFKKAKHVLEAFDNIFIDKVIDSNIFIDKVINSNIQNKQSDLKEDVMANAVILCGSPILAIPILSYFCKRINFFHSILSYFCKRINFFHSPQ
ncbi:exported protein (hyp6) [Plasmodium gaboni]|uniref:Exported protein (Hyp6) n=1 Tax=Plasmodium gaboni TaxID=647221 RepID=A0A151L2M4_9APIC|nr:exported protein (hyp6) [Plasmodium gaboni]KYN93213.1 exported protein (hyp6) [Plasmodium gaboni]